MESRQPASSSPPGLYKRLRVIAVREGVPVGKLLGLAIIKFLRENE